MDIKLINLLADGESLMAELQSHQVESVDQKAAEWIARVNDYVATLNRPFSTQSTLKGQALQALAVKLESALLQHLQWLQQQQQSGQQQHVVAQKYTQYA